MTPLPRFRFSSLCSSPIACILDRIEVTDGPARAVELALALAAAAR